MFRKTILTAVAALGLTFTPGLMTSTAEANGPYDHHHEAPRYYRPVIRTPLLVVQSPIVVQTPVVVAPVCRSYEVFYRDNCNAPWVCGGTFTSRYAADARMSYYQTHNFESYVAVR